MGTLEQKIIDDHLEAIKNRPEHKRGVADQELTLKRHGILEIEPKETPPRKVLRPVSRRKPSNKPATTKPIVPEQVELFRDENGNLTIKREE